jgi:flagellar basal body rod protein FlgC
MILVVIPAIGSASAALGAQFRRFEQSASRVANQKPAPDYVRETVEQIGASQAVAANVAVIRASDEMTETLFSVWA